MRMPADLGWSQLATARVGLWGIGSEARAGHRRLAQLGVTPVLVDDRPGPDDPLGPILATDAGGVEALLACDVVVKAPGIPPSHPVVAVLRDAGVTVIGGLALWLHEAPSDRVVAITGTKGKSTTVSILGHILRGLGHRTFVGGNLGVSPFDPAAIVDGEPELWVVEVSSYQAADLVRGPRVTAVTALSPDHLQWHGSVAAYYHDKLALTRAAGVEVTIAPAADATVRAHGAELGGQVLWIAGDGEDGWSHVLGLPGQHNIVNARIAATCAQQLGATDGDPAGLAAAAAGFESLHSRLETVASGHGVLVVDDGLSTNVLSCVAALEVYADRPVALLVGGQDRGIEHGLLGDAVRRRMFPTLLVALHSNGDAILEAVRSELADRPAAAAVELAASAAAANDPAGLRAATEHAVAWARQHAAVVLLSPAAPSFDHFRDYRDRSAQFAAIAGPLLQ